FSAARTPPSFTAPRFPSMAAADTPATGQAPDRSRAGGSFSPITVASRPEHVFPTLTPSQVSRLATLGKRLSATVDEELVQAGQRTTRFFVVEDGEIEIARPQAGGLRVVALVGSGQFTGEANMISGRPSMVRLRATRPSRLVELDRQHILSVVQ